MALGGDERVDPKGGPGAQNCADVVRIGDLVENQHKAVRRQVREVDRRERPRLEQQALMNRLARRAGGDLFEAHDPRFDPAGGDVGLSRAAAAGVA